MQAPKTLRKPANWQDFETLCLKLWGEVWNCHEIKKNGRIGQAQHGVDVYGVPSWDTEYYGIQCKGKDEYTNSQFTKKEIDSEIEKAEKFKPKLKKLYFATTAVKDTIIEEYVREKNLEHKTNGFFEVHLYSWEDIVDKIDENKQTHDWYVKSQNYKSNQSVDITFGDNSTEIILYPQFKQQKLVYIKTQVNFDLPPAFAALAKSQWLFKKDPSFSTTINKSYVGFFIKIHNTGREPLQDYKLLLKFKGNIEHIDDTNRKESTLALISKLHRVQLDTFVYPEDMSAKIVPIKSLLVGDDTFTSDEIFIKPHPNETKIEIEWKLLSRDFKANGTLTINLQPKIKMNRNFIKVEDKNEERTELGEIEDVIIIADDKDDEEDDWTPPHL